MDVATAGAAELKTVLVFVSKVITLRGSKGSISIDWRSDSDLLARTGLRSSIEIAGPVHASLGGLVDPTRGYNVGLVHHDREDETLPTSVQSVRSHRGALYLCQSAAIQTTEGEVGFDSNVTPIIEPTPPIGKSPRLVLYFDSFNTEGKSEHSLLIHFHCRVSGDKTPPFV